MTSPPDEQPFLRIVHGGEPSAEELAAVVVVLNARGAVERPSQTESAWVNRRGSLRRSLAHGADAWRLSVRPGQR